MSFCWDQEGLILYRHTVGRGGIAENIVDPRSLVKAERQHTEGPGGRVVWVAKLGVCHDRTGLLTRIRDCWEPIPGSM